MCPSPNSFLNKLTNFIWEVFIAASRLSLVAKNGGWLLLAAVHGLLNAVASLVAEHGLWSTSSVVAVHGLLMWWLLFMQSMGCRCTGSVVVVHGLSCPHSLWNLPGPGIKPMPPAWPGRFLSSIPPGKSWKCFQVGDSSVLSQK